MPNFHRREFHASRVHTPFHERCLEQRQVVTQRKYHGAQHVNHMWASLDAVTYPRYSDGAAVPVTVPNSKHGTAMVERTQLLVTKALDTPHRLYNHCAHYYFNGVCDLGAGCSFIHMVFVEAKASPAAPKTPTPADTQSCDSNAATPKSTASLHDAFMASQGSSDDTASIASAEAVEPSKLITLPARTRCWYYNPYTLTRVYTTTRSPVVIALKSMAS